MATDERNLPSGGAAQPRTDIASAPALPYGIAPAGYRLPATSRVGRVRLQVSDLDRSLAFYEGVLGLRVLSRSERAATLGPREGDDTPLVELHERAGAAPAPRRGRLGLYHFAILLPDRAALGRLVRHLAEVGAHAGTADHLVSEAVYLQDPDNLGVEVYADRPRAAWRRQGRELAMTTEPLDVRDLVAAAGDARWTGAPAGTAIGHVHLHVGDLARGAAFYHDALGFDKVVWSYPGALFLSAGGYHHHLGTNVWAADAAPPRADDARLLEWEIVLPDRASLDGAAASLARAGYAAERSERGDVATQDPWGTRVRLVPVSAG